MTALLVIGILVLLIVIHELGHFFVAKIFGVKVKEFGVGYPPRAFSFGTWGGTEYTFNWLPFGGFVRLLGDDDTQKRGAGSLLSAPRYVQALILVAGVTANAILAWMLFAWALTLGVPTLVDVPQPGETARLYVSSVVPGSPAGIGGLALGDEILSIQDAKGAKPENLYPADVMAFVSGRGGQPLTVTVFHAGTSSDKILRPANAVVPNSAERPALGIGLALVANQSHSFSESLVKAYPITIEAFKSTAQSLWFILSGSFTGKADLSDVVGPVGLVSIVGEAAHNGFGNVIKLAAFISVNLAIINLIPIPALDGGRLLLVAIEAVIRRDAPKLAVQVLNASGIALLILLMVFVTYNDIARIFA
jgi:regulator of sigma E protease